MLEVGGLGDPSHGGFYAWQVLETHTQTRDQIAVSMLRSDAQVMGGDCEECCISSGCWPERLNKPTRTL